MALFISKEPSLIPMPIRTEVIAVKQTRKDLLEQKATAHHKMKLMMAHVMVRISIYRAYVARMKHM